MTTIKELDDRVADIIGGDAFDGVVLWPTDKYRITGASDPDVETVRR